MGRRIPERLRLCGIDLSIRVMPCDGRLLPETSRGHLDYQKGLICIEADQGWQQQWQTLWHELMHIMLLNLIKENERSDIEEFIVDAMASWVFDLTRQMGLYGKEGR